MIYFVRFYFNVPNFVHPNPKVADNPKTLIKVNIHSVHIWQCQNLKDFRIKYRIIAVNKSKDFEN